MLAELWQLILDEAIVEILKTRCVPYLQSLLNPTACAVFNRNFFFLTECSIY